MTYEALAVGFSRLESAKGIANQLSGEPFDNCAPRFANFDAQTRKEE